MRTAKADPQLGGISPLTACLFGSSTTVTVDSVDTTYDLTFSLYSDDSFTTIVDENNPLSLNDLVWAKIETNVGENSLALVVDKCWCTAEDDAEADTKYELLTDG